MSDAIHLRRVLPFLTACTALTGSLVANFLLRQSGAQRTVELMVLSMPFTAALTVPMSAFLATLWVSRRLRAQSTARTMPRSLVGSVLIVSTGVAVATLALTAELVPRSNARLASVLAGHEVARGDRSMTLGELQAAARATRSVTPPASASAPSTLETSALRIREANYGIELHKKLVISASCIVLALAGLAIGWRLSQSGLAMMGVASAAVFAAFYASLMVAESLAEQLVVAPGIAMWAGTVIGLSVVAHSLRGASRWSAARA
jgi:lipopolysaccharide export LptBFGC system permease protein LptF